MPATLPGVNHGMITLGLTLLATPVESFDPIADVDARQKETIALARALWNAAELGYLEKRSTALLQVALTREGFTVETPVAGMPTAFVARYTQANGPVIALLAEMDALPGFSQAAVPKRKAVPGQSAGHACGHHLFGAASVSAAIAVKRWLASTGTGGEIRLVGTPAEEGGSGKVYLVRDGVFSDVDIVLHWHPDDENSAGIRTNNANRSAKFRFRGISTHAAAAPEHGRSALDGVEAMNYMVNLLREHTPDRTRIHYVVTSGGATPNVVPDFAEVYYYVRHPEPETLKRIWARVENAARGAAQGTGTDVDWEIIHGNLNLLPNEALQRLLHTELKKHGGIHYDSAERRFAKMLKRSLPGGGLALQRATDIRPFRSSFEAGSTDVGDVSWAVPTGGMRTATWVPGTPAHSWQAVAAGGMSIGFKGMGLAARVLAGAAVSLFHRPELVRRAKAEHARRRGKNYRYRPLLGQRPPPLDYRLPASGD